MQNAKAAQWFKCLLREVQYEVTVASFEDKVAQRAIVMLLEPIYEQDFRQCSFGFRSGRNAHQALRVIRHGIVGQSGGFAGVGRGDGDRDVRREHRAGVSAGDESGALLRRWRLRLGELGVRFAMHHRWVGLRPGIRGGWISRLRIRTAEASRAWMRMP